MAYGETAIVSQVPTRGSNSSTRCPALPSLLQPPATIIRPSDIMAAEWSVLANVRLPAGYQTFFSGSYISAFATVEAAPAPPTTKTRPSLKTVAE